MSHRHELLKTARAGDVRAPFELACAYDFDRPKKKPLAIYWYHKAAEQGHAKSQNYLGESYRDGWTVERDLRAAIHWFRLAAAQGEPDAQLSLGYLLFYGVLLSRQPGRVLHQRSWGRPSSAR